MLRGGVSKHGANNLCNRLLKQSIHSSARIMVRQRAELKLRPPIPPTLKNIKVPEDHPLWGFFSDKKYIRATEDLDNIGEAWSIPYLRKKSFEDLHTLWYVSLKERNKLLRESRIYQALPHASKEEDPYLRVSEKIKDTMWRIRHVLSERYHSHIRGNIEFKENYDEVIGEFTERYLTADAGQDGEMEAQLERFQYALFGINPLLEENIPTPDLIKGLKLVSDLKLKRFYSAEDPEGEFSNVRDINEAFIVFTAEHTPEGIQDAVASITEYRASGDPLDPNDEYALLARLILNFENERAKSISEEA